MNETQKPATADIEAFIVRLLLEKGPLPEDVAVAAYRYLDAGHIDSLGLIKFMFRLEDAYGISFAEQDLLGDRMRTVGGLGDLVAEKIAMLSRKEA